MRSKIVCVLSLLLVLLCAEHVAACSCSGGGAPCQEYGRASAVFIGTATGLEERKPGSIDDARRQADAGEYEPRYAYKFAVQEVFGGVEMGETEVSTGSGGGDCGYRFKKGEQYLVYAYRNPRTNRLSTNICTRTRLTSEASEDLAFLRSLSGRASGAALFIKVVVPDADERVMQIPISVEGEGMSREVRADGQGQYKLTGLKPGTYTVKLTLPDDLYTYSREEKVRIADRGCGDVSFYLTENGRITGRVVDVQGSPVAGITINAVAADKADEENPDLKYAKTDAEGNFKFEALKSNRYLLGVRLARFPQHGDLTNAYPRMYYPGVESPAQAEAIEVGAGAQVKNLELRMLPRRTERTLTGVVVWSDGRPVKNANVSYRETTYRDPGINNGLSADEQGRFSLKAYDGLTYVFTAYSSEKYNGTPVHVEPVTVAVNGDMEPVKIIIPVRGTDRQPAAKKP